MAMVLTNMIQIPTILVMHKKIEIQAIVMS